MSNVLAVGTVAFDAIETPFGKTDRIVGGAATYAALSASYFTKPVHIVSVVGDDFPVEMIEQFHSHGITTDGMQIKQGEKSFFWRGKYHADMNSRDTLDTQLNVLATFDPIVPAAIANSEFLLLGNLLPQVQMQVLQRMAKRPQLVVMDTMNFWIESEHAALMEMIPQTDVLSVNDEEARLLSKEYSLRKAARKIMDMGPKTLIIKKGEHGALLFQGKEVFFAPALPLEEVFDPTGAGDTFAGGFIGYLAKSGDTSFENMKRAIIFGSAMASFCVEKFGPERLLNLTDKEITARVNDFYSLVQFDLIDALNV